MSEEAPSHGTFTVCTGGDGLAEHPHEPRDIAEPAAVFLDLLGVGLRRPEFDVDFNLPSSSRCRRETNHYHPRPAHSTS
jgi:hypothetical protein